ncbi:hypothetical protein ACFL5L_06535, partial [candidate division KSB1 bacterium]
QAGREQLEKGTIINVNNRLIKFNMGRFDGVEEHFLFDIYRRVGSSRHPVTGEPIEPRSQYIGRAQVVNVGDTDALAQIVAQEREILAGDRVSLSAQQTGDLELEEEQPVMQPAEAVMPQVVPRPQIPESLSPADNIVGTITRVSDRDLFFIWRGDYDFPSGRIFGIFRREELRHPESGEVIGTPLILLGKLSLVESIGEIGRAALLSFDAEILPQDLVGLTEGETVQSGQVITPENAVQVYQARRSDILNQAYELTNQVQQIQGEMTILRSTLDRLDQIERGLASQKATTDAINRTLEEIKMLLRGEGFPIEGSSLVPSRASIDKMEIPGTNANVLRLRYTDDIDVKFELVDRTLNVSLEVDSTGLTRTTPAVPVERPTIQQPGAEIMSPEDTIGAGTTLESVVTEEEGSIFTSGIFLLGMIVALLGIAGALYFLLVKKKSSGAVQEEHDEEIEGDEEEGDFGEEEMAADEEEEEIETFDEET